MSALPVHERLVKARFRLYIFKERKPTQAAVPKRGVRVENGEGTIVEVQESNGQREVRRDEERVWANDEAFD